jgi:tetratricopeptide (TPR) repeat protein
MPGRPTTLRLGPCGILWGIWLATLLMMASGLSAQEAMLWGDLEPGPHGVGYMAIEHYDYARSFQPKRDYFGEVIPGERGRPIQICIWYPAVVQADAVAGGMSDYAFSPPEDMRHYAFLAGIQNREIGFLHAILNNNQTAVFEVLGTDMKAVRGADPAEGRFPLLVYHSDLGSGIAENAVMFEYLASHGFVVATTHSFGPSAVNAEPTAAALETLVGDMEFVIAALRDMEFVDPDKLGVFGYRAGGLAALLLGMRNHNVDAVLGLETVSADQEVLDLAAANPFYSMARMTAPLLQAYNLTEDGRGRTLMESFRYTPGYSLSFEGGPAVAFTTYRIIAGIFGEPDPGGGGADPATYGVPCAYARNFFDGHLNGREESLEFLTASPGAHGLDPGTVTLTMMDARQRPPTQGEFMAILQEDRVDTAVAIYEKFRSEEPDLVLFPEAQMNMMGYRYLQRGMVPEAISIMKMNAEAYPRSANCWDSLTEAYIAGGDNEHALKCVDMVLQVLPEDTNITEEFKQTLQVNAERYKTMLEGSAEDDVQ